MFLDGGRKPENPERTRREPGENPERTHADTGRTDRTSRGSNPDPWSCEATVLIFKYLD